MFPTWIRVDSLPLLRENKSQVLGCAAACDVLRSARLDRPPHPPPTLLHGSLGQMPSGRLAWGEPSMIKGASARPFKANADRRHRIPWQRHRVANWVTYDAGLQARVEPDRGSGTRTWRYPSRSG